MHMESGRRTLSGGHPDCRSLPCSPARVGGSAPTLSPGRSPTESLDEGPPEAPVGQGENRKTGGRTAGHLHRQSRPGREDSHRGRLLREECRADAFIPNFAANTCLLARVSLKLDARRWSALASNNRECSGPSGEPTLSWRCAAPISMDALRTIGRSVARLGRHDIHFYVAHPCRRCRHANPYSFNLRNKSSGTSVV